MAGYSDEGCHRQVSGTRGLRHSSRARLLRKGGEGCGMMMWIMLSEAMTSVNTSTKGKLW